MVGMCYEGLDPTSGVVNTVRSMFDDISGPLNALVAMVNADKR